ncbi:MAG TPA: DUF4440 domain-containing protein [Allosphingosinicella sp.]|jgi:hypothetical protein
MQILVALAAAAAAAAAAAQPGVPVPDQPALTEQIAARDAELFELFFTGPCDSVRFRAMLADDVEFYHDKGGFNVRKPEDFVAIFAKNCADRQDPKAWRSRRELVRTSLHVDPVPGYGAIEAGEHLFYEREGERGEEKLAGRARFAQLWVLGGDGKWRLSRVLSYAHEAAK